MVDETKILKLYQPYVTTLREVARMCDTNHHTVRRVLQRAGVKVVKGRRGPLSESHREKLRDAARKRPPRMKGRKATPRETYVNMASHLRFDVSPEWLAQFDDIERLKFLNRCVCRSSRFPVDTDWYKAFIERFYADAAFIQTYDKWRASGYCKWRRPTLDHIVPRALGGDNDLGNLQFLTWLENRAKCDMPQAEWDSIKHRIHDYFT